MRMPSIKRSIMALVIFMAALCTGRAVEPVAEWNFATEQPEGAARFDGGGAGREYPQAKKLAAGAFTFDVRFKAEARGGLIQTPIGSLVLHESGILVALLSMNGMYREVPLSPVTFHEWHDVRLRWDDRQHQLDLVVDGMRLNRVVLPGRLTPLDDAPTRVGAWMMPDPAVPGFAPKDRAWLFERPFLGLIARATIWDRAIEEPDHEREPPASQPISGAQRCLEDYRAFFEASQRKDIDATRRLGRSMRTFLARDPRRPVYHLTAPMGDLLDPAGAWFDGRRYHVFSYRNMISLLSATPLVHYVSDDLIRWEDYPIAVWPDTDLDVQGIWLANFIRDQHGDTQMLYTALGRKGKIGVLARSNDGLVSFTDKRPVITDLVHHDGHVWKDGSAWLAITTQQHWGRKEGRGDGILLLHSHDLETWTQRGEIFAVPPHPSPKDDKQRWGFTEFPYLLPFGDRHVLMLGTRPSRYWVGRFDPTKPAFIPDEPQGRLLDILNSFHCFNPSAVDAQGRRIIMGMNIHLSGAVEGIPWAGAHTIPRILTLEGDHLRQEPVATIESLRGAHQYRTGLRILPGANGHLPGLTGDTLEVIATFDPGTSKRFGLIVRGGTKIYVDPGANRFGAAGNIKLGAPYPELGEGPAFLPPGKPVQIRVFLDRALLEVFVNGQTGTGVLTAKPEEQSLDLFSEGGEAILQRLDVWEMKP